jgi:hypothetical protein
LKDDPQQSPKVDVNFSLLFLKASKSEGQTMSNEKPLFVEPRDEGGFKVVREHAQRASKVADTQAEAIALAKALEPNAPIHVARVRHLQGDVPQPDKYRKIK